MPRILQSRQFALVAEPEVTSESTCMCYCVQGFAAQPHIMRTQKFDGQSHRRLSRMSRCLLAQYAHYDIVK